MKIFNLNIIIENRLLSLEHSSKLEINQKIDLQPFDKVEIPQLSHYFNKYWVNKTNSHNANFNRKLFGAIYETRHPILDSF